MWAPVTNHERSGNRETPLGTLAEKSKSVNANILSFFFVSSYFCIVGSMSNPNLYFTLIIMHEFAVNLPLAYFIVFNFTLNSP